LIPYEVAGLVLADQQTLGYAEVQEPHFPDGLELPALTIYQTDYSRLSDIKDTLLVNIQRPGKIMVRLGI
jgi:hypothetical protein